MIYGIISYHRAENQKTLDFLTGNGVPKERIILSLNDTEDLSGYERRYSRRATIICKTKGNAAGNRNNILDYVGEGEKLVLLDDDVKAFKKWEPGGKQGTMVDLGFKGFEAMMEEGFNLAQAFGTRLFGLYPVANPLYMKQATGNDGPVTLNKLFQGGCLGIVTSKDRFDERVPVCDDYEFILRQIASGRGVIRLNSYAAVKEKDFDTKGGCHDAYASGAQKKALLMIAHKYSNLVTVKKDYTGLRMKGRKK